MKTCKDRIYYVPELSQEPPEGRINCNRRGVCRLFPKQVKGVETYWGGQLKEKAPRATNLEELGLSKRIINQLLSEYIDIHKLRGMTEVDLLKLPNIGHSTLHDIRAALYRDVHGINHDT